MRPGEVLDARADLLERLNDSQVAETLNAQELSDSGKMVWRYLLTHPDHEEILDSVVSRGTPVPNTESSEMVSVKIVQPQPAKEQ